MQYWFDSGSGTILDNLEAVDAIDAFTSSWNVIRGTKIRACQIINELENDRRGILWWRCWIY